MRKFTRLTALFMVLVVAMSVLAVPAMAAEDGAQAPTVTSNSDLDEGVTITGFEADGDLTETLEFTTDSTVDTQEVAVNVSYDGNSRHTATDASASYEEVSDDDVDVTHTFTIDHDNLDTVPGGAGDAVPVDITIEHTYLDANDEEVTDWTTITVTLEFADNHAVIYTASADDKISTLEEDDSFLARFARFDDSQASVEEDVNITGDATTINVYVDDDYMADQFESAAEDAESGDRIAYMMTSSLDDQIVYVFADEPGEVPVDDFDEDTDTYAIYHGDGHMTFELGEDRFDEDDSEVSVSAVGNEKVEKSLLQDDLGYSMLQAYGLSFDTFDLGKLWPFMSSSLLAGGVVVSRRRVAA